MLLFFQLHSQQLDEWLGQRLLVMAEEVQGRRIWSNSQYFEGG